MKKTTLLISSLILAAFLTASGQGILGKIKDKVKQRSDAKVDNTIDKGLDKAEDAGKTNKDNPQEHYTTPADQNSSVNNTGNQKPADLVSYGKYDFVPGDKIIFEDHVEKETVGEFPSKWNLHSGKLEIATLNGEQVIAFLEGNYASIAPLMEKPGDYLPDVFSLEFDHYVKSSGYTTMEIALHDDKDETYKWDGDDVLGGWAITSGSSAKVLVAAGDYPNAENYYDKWHHIAISFNKGNIKIYTDQFRLCNLPRVSGKSNPSGIAFGCIGDPTGTVFIKNIRIAAGGGDLYKRVATESRIITHGIRFDVSKSTLKPESMGTLNEIVKIMKDNPEIKFEVGGHTDSDGGDALNLKLSQARADAVKAQLIILGIDAGRLTSKGYGQTKPIDQNSTPEGKANNRRVEFVKI